MLFFAIILVEIHPQALALWFNHKMSTSSNLHKRFAQQTLEFRLYNFPDSKSGCGDRKRNMSGTILPIRLCVYWGIYIMDNYWNRCLLSFFSFYLLLTFLIITWKVIWRAFINKGYIPVIISHFKWSLYIYMHYVSLVCSHNTKSTTWLDPRLVKKAKPPEKCEDGGKLHFYT